MQCNSPEPPSSSSFDSEDDYSDYEDALHTIKKKNAAMYSIPPEYQREADKAVTKLVSELQLSFNKPQKLTGNRPIAENTVSAYRKHFNGRSLSYSVDS